MAEAVKGKRRYNSTLREQQAQLTRARILDAARRLLAAGTYSSVTMADIATEAGVAYQTVYGIFGSKVRLADALIQAGFSHVSQAMALFDSLRDLADVEQSLRVAARATRLALEPCADLVRFIRESGDRELLDGYVQREQARYEAILDSGLPEKLERSGRLCADVTPSEAAATVWAMTGADLYNKLVFERGWTADRYQEWLAGALIRIVLEPA